MFAHLVFSPTVLASRLHVGPGEDYVTVDETLRAADDGDLVLVEHLLGNEAVDDGGALAAFDVPTLVLRNDLVAWTRAGIAVFADADTIVVNDHNAFHDNADGDLDGPAPGALDVLDVDGSTSDIGALGGPAADPCVGSPDPRPAACLR